MKKAGKPKVERVNRFEGKAAGDFLDIMMGEIFSPSRFFIQVRLIAVTLNDFQFAVKRPRGR